MMDCGCVTLHEAPDGVFFLLMNERVVMMIGYHGDWLYFQYLNAQFLCLSSNFGAQRRA